MAKDTRRQCTAKSRRTGKQCQSYAEKDGKGLCYHHRGRLTVGKPNFIHGLYSRGLNAKEKAEWEEVPLGNVDDEIRLARVQLARIVKLQAEVDAAPRLDDGGLEDPRHARMEVAEISHRPASKGEDGTPKSTGRKTVWRRPDYRGMMERLLDRIAKLESVRMVLPQQGASDDMLRREGETPEDQIMRLLLMAKARKNAGA